MYAESQTTCELPAGKRWNRYIALSDNTIHAHNETCLLSNFRCVGNDSVRSDVGLLVYCLPVNV